MNKADLKSEVKNHLSEVVNSTYDHYKNYENTLSDKTLSTKIIKAEIVDIKRHVGH